MSGHAEEQIGDVLTGSSSVPEDRHPSIVDVHSPK